MERHSEAIQKARMRSLGWRGVGGLNEKAQANPDRLLLSHHCHYFVIMVVGASLHVLLITDKGLEDVRANTKTELKQGGKLLQSLGRRTAETH